MTHLSPFDSALAAAVVLAVVPALALASGPKAPKAPEGPTEAAWAAEASNSFAAGLHRTLSAAKGNLFFSPNSIETALAMTLAGARGRTAEQLAAVLHLPADRADLHRSMGALLGSFNAATGPDGKPRPFQLSAANALWGQRGFEFLPAYLKLVEDNYGAGLASLDFAKDAPGARRTINAWIEKRTRDRIKDLIPEGLLDERTRLVLTNAVYFKGAWNRPFEKSETRDEPFRLTPGSETKVPMMHVQDRYPYKETTDYQALKLPYAGGELSMVVLLPKEADGLAALERRVTPKLLNEDLKGLRHEEVVVALPRFRMTRELELSKVLGEMGMPDAFSAADADFSGMDGRKDLFLTAVVHKAFVEVNEEGTEAAAATAGVVGITSAMPEPRSPVVFRADHPFLFVIRHERSGAILFMGRVANPAA